MKKKYTVLALLIVIGVILASCGNSDKKATGGSGDQETYPNAQLLVDVAWVKQNQKDEKTIIIDARSKGYEQGHIPGAIHLTSNKLNDPTNPVQGFLVNEEEFTEVVQQAGVNADSTIVVYDEGNGMGATRLFYAFEYYGLKNQVKLLNGGFTAWLTAEEDVSTDEVTLPQGNFVAKVQSDLISTAEHIQQNLENEKYVFLDVRSIDEFTGKDLRGNLRGGHIPGAVNQEWSLAIDQNTDDGVPKFKSYQQLSADFEKLGLKKDITVVPYCQTNIRGAHTYFVLRLLGYEDIRPYEGSWAEWGNDEKTPIAN